MDKLPNIHPGEVLREKHWTGSPGSSLPKSNPMPAPFDLAGTNRSTSSKQPPLILSCFVSATG